MWILKSFGALRNATALIGTTLAGKTLIGSQVTQVGTTLAQRYITDMFGKMTTVRNGN